MTSVAPPARILITGATGQIGWELQRSLQPLGQIMALDRQQCNLSTPERLPKILNDLRPTMIVNAAAYTAVDKAEDEEAVATIINATAVGVMAEWARTHHCALVHYSTDYVFDGSQSTPYREHDPPQPLNAYGRSKLAGEQIAQQIGGQLLILRTSWVYAARGHNFVRTMLRLAHEKEEIRVVNDQTGAPTWARHIADSTAHLLRLPPDSWPTVLHLSAQGKTDWHEFATTIVHEWKKHTALSNIRLQKIVAISSAEYAAQAARPRYSLLDCRLLDNIAHLRLPDWRDSLALCVQEIAESSMLTPLIRQG